jgi:TM2 domain-containing membrane protein YozV
MKISFLSLIVILFFSSAADAQYRLNKTMYKSKDYSHQFGDPYNPSVAGLTSFLVPGLGQMISGEPGRGMAFLGGFAGGAIMIAAGVSQSYKYTEDSPGNEGSWVLVTGLVAVGLIDMIVMDIWAVSDAIHVAKINNLASRDKNKTGFNVKFSPYYGAFNNETVSIGLSLKIRF